jgi:hypothetical protein
LGYLLHGDKVRILGGQELETVVARILGRSLLSEQMKLISQKIVCVKSTMFYEGKLTAERSLKYFLEQLNLLYIFSFEFHVVLHLKQLLQVSSSNAFFRTSRKSL